MSTYVSLVNWTDQGIRNYKDTVNRAKGADALIGKYGGRIVSIHWTLGAYDLVVVSEAPDDESATAFLLELCSLGNVKTQTMRAFDADEMAAIIARSG